ncbi:hypothetical protein [Pontibacter akesuensis]|uniref:Uncharacterized protein n=1 Tax=Pontibacter akesuensis TaxID=388950 RepID=A0A1I7GYR4_9BACT|nr:hypothetical protein [Pontibacter akesuensis]GHA54473.1 hypothetical protein GCM10007389_02240 [Pontibacter akesuensis]SFU53396.1 hypothetical protein SAMN04487941_1355 [Pontibacter akesuensis]
MLNKLPFLFLLFIVQIALADNPSSYKLTVLREEYRAASLDADVASRFNKKMMAYKGEDASVLAYKAASEAVMAKYVWNPYSKLKQVKSAAAIFEKAVEKDADNPEIRFLRFTVEYYVPRYLNLSPNIEKDKKIVIEALKEHPKSGMPTELARTILDFMISKEHTTPAEKKVLQRIDI